MVEMICKELGVEVEEEWVVDMDNIRDAINSLEISLIRNGYN